MKDYRDAKVHQYWNDDEFNEMLTILETVKGELRLIITPNPKNENKEKQ